MKFIKNKALFFSTGVLLLIFFWLIFALDSAAIKAFDSAVYESLYKASWLTSVMKVITFLGEGVTLIGITVVIIMFTKDRLKSLIIPLNLAIIGLINHSIKALVKRPRPEGFRLIPIDGYSFPSGHSATSFAFYGYLVYLILKNCRNRALKIGGTIALCCLVVLIGISRIYLGVHYASDVVAGFILAAIYLMLFISLTDLRR